MSVDYILSIKRKKDDKEIGRVCCNWLKQIFDFDPSETFENDNNSRKYTVEDLQKVENTVITKIEENYNSVHEKLMMIPMCKNVEIKHELEEDINIIKEDIKELFWTLGNARTIIGQIDCLVEDNIKISKTKKKSEGEFNCAYRYNMDDLNKDKSKEKNKEYLWNSDIYFNIIASY